jgi:hypothetical protein
MADRYAYIPLIGIFVMIAWAVADLADSLELGVTARMVPAACVLLALSFATHRQLGYWSSNYDLWTHALAVTDRNVIAQDNLGGALLMLGQPQAHLPGCSRDNPSDPMSHSNPGAYLQNTEIDWAIEQYDRTISLTSDAAAGGHLRQSWHRLPKLGGRKAASYDQPAAEPRSIQPIWDWALLENKTSWMTPYGIIQVGRTAPDRHRVSAAGACSSARDGVRKRWRPELH